MCLFIDDETTVEITSSDIPAGSRYILGNKFSENEILSEELVITGQVF